MTLPNADDPRGGTPMNTDDELRQRAITALKSSVMSFTDYGAKQIWEALAPIIVTDRRKSNLQRAIDELKNIKVQDPEAVSSQGVDWTAFYYIQDHIKALQAELQQAEKEQV